MPDSAVVAVPSDLRILVTGSADKAVVKDKSGAEHTLCPLDLSDLCEYEEKVGSSVLGSSLASVKLRDITYLLYLSLRKEGLSAADIEARKFRYTERQVCLMFDLAFLRKSAEVFVDLLRISGLDMRPLPASQNDGSVNGTQA